MSTNVRCLLVICCLVGLLSVAPAVSSQERDLPEEVRALSVVCSSGASVDFRGQLEGGINRFFGKVLEAEGALELSKSEADFLSSFDDEDLRLKARAIYNECVLGALQIVYNLKKEEKLGALDSRLLVPDTLSKISPGERFALTVGDIVGFDKNGILMIRDARDDCSIVSLEASNLRERKANLSMRVPQHFTLPKQNECWLSLYGSRSFGEDNRCVFSFMYQCE